jgi:hypothetical protein
MKKLGFCHTCKQWYDLGKSSWLPDHNKPGGEKCPDSKYSHWGLKYQLENRADAIKMAKIIASDKGGCLESGGGLHSMGCGDGDHCDATRLRRSQALADYFLANNKKE